MKEKVFANPVDLMTSVLACSKSELAAQLGVSPALITIWHKRGGVTLRYLRKAVEVTGLPPHMLNPLVPPSPLEKRNEAASAQGAAE